MSAGTPTAPDLVVVGAGIVGLGAALAARRAGLEVLVVERDAEPLGASVRNFGHLCFTPQSGSARRYAARSRERWLELAHDAGLPVARRGTLVPARHDDELALLEAFARHRAAEPDVFGTEPEVELLDAREAAERLPVPAERLAGGARLPYDLQTDPRRAAPALRRRLIELGVGFRLRTAVGAVRATPTGVRVETSRGPIDAGRAIVAVNHDIDRLFPDVAERIGIERCALDMLRVTVALRRELDAPLLTGWSLVRYAGFAALAEAAPVRERLHAAEPLLAALDVNLMATAAPDGSILLGDTHRRGPVATPFQAEAAFDALLAAGAELFGAAPTVLERWQGVYAAGPEEFLLEEPEPGVRLVAATTGIGMSCGLGLAEHAATAETLDPAPRKDTTP